MKERSRRLDVLLVERGLAENRSRARGLILSGSVRVGDRVVTKTGSHFTPDESLTVEKPMPYVSRAGEKLARALDDFGIDVSGRSCLDAGASTGGFTDVLLQRGAEAVISADVGYGQLDWKLRNDPRVMVLERTNVRKLSGKVLPFAPGLLVADLSFISLAVALEKLLRSTPSISEAVVLIKPQFEAGPDQVGRGGLVRDPKVHDSVIHAVVEAFRDLDFGAVGVTRSPVTGRRSGNQEYPLHLLRGGRPTVHEDAVRAVVSGA